MADIDVVRKGGMPAWVWLLIAVVVVVGLFALMNFRNADGPDTNAPQSRVGTPLGERPLAATA